MTELKRVDYHRMVTIHSKGIRQEWTSAHTNKRKSLILLLET